ncbi:MAG: efflux RND transporter periplasmic adaptor subunit [Candidatus Cloacimonetes bacterium]|nr:efflux RND transporter periplasmic adaptor subunit [Candidatus Cloacimonadota bacterium]
MRWHLPIKVLSIVVLGLVFMGCFQNKPQTEPEQIVIPRPVKAMVLQPINTAPVRSFPGRTRALRETALGFRIPGMILELRAKEGQVVQSQEILGQLDPRDFILKTEELHSRLDAAKAQLSQMRSGARTEDISILEARLKSAESGAATAEQDFLRYEGLYVQEAVTKSDLDRVRLNFDQAKAQLEASKRELQKAKAGSREEEISAQEAQVHSLESALSQAQAALLDTSLRAPFAGHVSRRLSNSFEQVAAGQTVFGLVDLSVLEVVFSLPENLIGTVKPGMQVQIRVSQYPKDLDAVITSISPAADPNSQTWPAIVELNNPNNLVLPGMSAEVLLIPGNEVPGYVVPVSSLVKSRTGSETFVYLVDVLNKTVHKKTVKLGKMMQGLPVITEGLKDGDILVTAGTSWLLDGQSIRVDPALIQGYNP